MSFTKRIFVLSMAGLLSVTVSVGFVSANPWGNNFASIIPPNVAYDWDAGNDDPDDYETYDIIETMHSFFEDGYLIHHLWEWDYLEEDVLLHLHNNGDYIWTGESELCMSFENGWYQGSWYQYMNRTFSSCP